MMRSKEFFWLGGSWKCLLLFLIFAACAPGVSVKNREQATNGCGHPRNIIVMVPDGCSQAVQTLARWHTGQPLALEAMVSGMIKTHDANSVVTDSASAATAFATGHKTTDGFLAVGPKADGLLTGFTPTLDPYVPAATVLEGAKLMGKSVGLVATSRITHATPAGFAAHVHSRKLDNEIMEQMVYQDLDVVFGGGKEYLLPPSAGGKRTDGEDFYQVLLDRGYQWVENKDDMDALVSGKAWGLFASGHMEADIDRAHFAPAQPSLAEMTSKAIALLSQNQRGFFLMVEASQVDWADHAMDPIHSVTDFVAFDKAVKAAVEFAQRDGNTLILIFPDHNTGGLTIGNRSTDSTYKGMSLEMVLHPLAAMKITSTGLGYHIGEAKDIRFIASQILEWWGIETTEEDNNEIAALMDKGLSVSSAVSEVISRNHTVFGWTTHGHTGDDVPLWSFGPNRPVGLFDNTDLAKMIACGFGFSLEAMSDRLFVDAAKVFPAQDITIDPTDPANPVLMIRGARLPEGKDLLILHGKTHHLEGIVVPAPEIKKHFIPSQAVTLIKNSMGEYIK